MTLVSQQQKRYPVTMTTTTHRTPPAPIRAHLHRAAGTTAHHADARIAEVFTLGLGWSEYHAQPFPSPSAIKVLRQRGITSFAIAYNRPHKGGRVFADFTVAECLR
jgi:hypothetical protein